MAILYAGIVPHSPVLLPTIGKAHTERLKKTIIALEHMNEQLIAHDIETLVVIAPHRAPYDDAGHAFHVSPHYTAQFATFGDLATTLDAPSDTVLADALIERVRERGVAVAYQSGEELEYSISVPLFYLKKNLPLTKIIAIHPGEPEALKECTVFGKHLQAPLQATERRIAILASGELCHCLTPDAPGGYDTHSIAFEHEMVRAIKAQRVKKLEKLSLDLIQSYGVCAIQPCLTLFGILERMTYAASCISYEYPLGVGHIVMEFTL